MKLYVLYEQTCDGVSGHRYFTSESKCKEAYDKELSMYDKFPSGWDRFYWRFHKIETED